MYVKYKPYNTGPLTCCLHIIPNYQLCVLFESGWCHLFHASSMLLSGSKRVTLVQSGINRCWERMQLMLILPVATFLQNPVLQPLATADYFQKRVGCWHHIPLNRQQLPSNHLPSQFLSTDIDQDTLTVILMSTADVGDRLHGMVQHSVWKWLNPRASSIVFTI